MTAANANRRATAGANRRAMAGADFSGRLMIDLDGVEITAADRRRLRHPAVGGVVLFARNFAAAAQLRQLTAAARRAAARPILIAVDREGGRVERFRGDGFTRLPPMAAIGAVYAADEKRGLARARAAGVVCAAELLAVGIDFSFAPVADLRGQATVVGDRAFAADPGAVAALARAFAGGLAAAGMGFCGKHFPGHGFADADSHLRAAVDARGRAVILRNDIIPFAALCADARRAAMMTAHVRYPRFDAKIATYSEFWIQKMLREKLGFRGLVVADDLAMAAAAVAGPMVARLAAARAGGCDAMLVCDACADDSFLPDLAAKDGAKNPWRALAPKNGARVSVGCPAYARARVELAAA